MKHPEGKYAWTVTVGEKGQIVIPKKARDLFDIKPGDTLMLLADIQQGIAIPPKSLFTTLMTTVFRTGGLEKGEDEP
jgi:AbrB family looped-hinge helix DNA binding protein